MVKMAKGKQGAAKTSKASTKAKKTPGKQDIIEEQVSKDKKIKSLTTKKNVEPFISIFDVSPDKVPSNAAKACADEEGSDSDTDHGDDGDLGGDSDDDIDDKNNGFVTN